MKNKTGIILLIIIGAIAVGISFYRYQILLEYYTWRLQKADNKYAENCEDDLTAIAPHVKNSMAQIYLKESILMPHFSRVTIGEALAATDNLYAERLFCNGLSSQSPQIIEASITNLDLMRSTACYDRIYKLRGKAKK